MSYVLAQFLARRENADGDRQAEAECAPTIEFAIALIGDRPLKAVTVDLLVMLEESMADIPTKLGFSDDEGSLFRLYAIA